MPFFDATDWSCVENQIKEDTNRKLKIARWYGKSCGQDMGEWIKVCGYICDSNDSTDIRQATQLPASTG